MIHLQQIKNLKTPNKTQNKMQQRLCKKNLHATKEKTTTTKYVYFEIANHQK
jgi:hypothetical protein